MLIIINKINTFLKYLIKYCFNKDTCKDLSTSLNGHCFHTLNRNVIGYNAQCCKTQISPMVLPILQKDPLQK